MASFVDRMIGAAKLDAATFEEIEADKTALGQAIAVVAFSSAASSVGTGHFNPLTLALWTFVSLGLWFLWAWVTFLVGTKLLPEPETKSNLAEMFRVMGFSSVPGILGLGQLIPFLGPLVGLVSLLWQLAAMVVAVRQSLDYKSTARAVGVVAVGFLIYLMGISLFLPFLVRSTMV